MTIRPYRAIMITVILTMLLLPAAAWAQSITLLIPAAPDVSNFPEMRVAVRVQDARGYVIPGLENAFSVRESSEFASNAPAFTPAVAFNDRGGTRVAISLVLDTRNNTSREELNVARDFARQIVETLKMAPDPSSQEGDMIELWVPGPQSTVVVPFEQGDAVTLINAINQVLPYEGDSIGFDELLRQIIANKTPDNLPHVVVVTGKVANINPTMEAGTLAGLAQQRMVVLYAAPTETSRDSGFLSALALPSDGLVLQPSVDTAVQLVDDLKAKYKGEYILTYTSPLTPASNGHAVQVSINGPTGNITASTTYSTEWEPIENVGIRLGGVLVFPTALVILGLAVLFAAYKGVGGIFERRHTVP